LEQELRLPIFNVTSSDLASKKPEKQLAAIFEQAVAMGPCILFIDEIDRILLETVTTGRKKTSSIVTQLSTCMDGKVNGFDREVVLNTFFETADMIRSGLGQKKNKANVLVIAATRRPDGLDKDLRLAGRFDSAIALGKPNEPTREKMLQAFCRHLPSKLNLDWKILAKKMVDFNGADLKSLTDKAINIAKKRFTR
jgi:ribosome biogenesis ATPase